MGLRSACAAGDSGAGRACLRAAHRPAVLGNTMLLSCERVLQLARAGPRASSTGRAKLRKASCRARAEQPRVSEPGTCFELWLVQATYQRQLEHASRIRPGLHRHGHAP